MRLYIITGQPSGDLHASNLVRSLNKLEDNISVRGWGGERLLSEGIEVAKHISSISYMGILDVIKNLSSIKRNLEFCKNDILDFSPDAIILVDYPGFNLKIAEFAKKQGIKVFYYISPKVWAWNKSRVTKIKKYIDHLIVIFPFEVEFYKQYGIKANYFGNPLLDEIEKDINSFSFKSEKPIIALLPGSRKQEIDAILPEMLSIVNDFADFQFVISAVNTFNKEYYESFINDDIPIIFDNTYSILKKADYALVTSGTATLEAALFKVPQIVCYKTNWLTYMIGKILVKLEYISLVNILMNRNIVRELIQSELRSFNIKKELNNLMINKEEIRKEYSQLIDLLGEKGSSKRVAQFIIDTI